MENFMAAIAAVNGLVPDEIIRDFAKTFGGVEHRIELVRTLDGVRYYNDSIASSPTRTIAGLRSFHEKVILIAGGYDKHIPYGPLGPEIISHVKKLILTGATAPKIGPQSEQSLGYDAGSLPLWSVITSAMRFCLRMHWRNRGMWSYCLRPARPSTISRILWSGDRLLKISSTNCKWM